MTPYCSGCGSPIPEGQGHSCSMCYGDPDYGRDGYYQQFLDQQAQAAAEAQAQDEAYQQDMEEQAAAEPRRPSPQGNGRRNGRQSARRLAGWPKNNNRRRPMSITDIHKETDDQLMTEALQLDDLVNVVECFSTRDVTRLDQVVAELERRGFKAERRLQFHKGE